MHCGLLFERPPNGLDWVFGWQSENGETEEVVFDDAIFRRIELPKRPTRCPKKPTENDPSQLADSFVQFTKTVEGGDVLIKQIAFSSFMDSGEDADLDLETFNLDALLRMLGSSNLKFNQEQEIITYHYVNINKKHRIREIRDGGSSEEGLATVLTNRPAQRFIDFFIVCPIY
jgi:hypothetical protein